MRPLALKDGIAPSFCWLNPAPEPLLQRLCQRFSHISGEVWLQRFATGEVVGDDGQPLSPQQIINRDTRVWFYRQVADETKIPFDEQIIYQDERILVVDKPHFLPTTPGGKYLRETLLVRLKNSTGIDTLQPLHRLDRETAGLVAFCIQPAQRHHYQQLFASRQVMKVYHAIAPLNEDINLPLELSNRLVERNDCRLMQVVSGEANSHTLIELIARQQNWGYFRLIPSTGKKHQLRLHMAQLGMPLCCDRLYGPLANSADDYQQPLRLLAYQLQFCDPFTFQTHQFQSQQRLVWPQ